MSRSKLLAAALAIVLAAAGTGLAFELIYDYGNGTEPAAWPDARATMYLHSITFPLNDPYGDAVRSALATWNRVWGCAFRFDRVDGTSGVYYYSYAMHFDGYNDVAGLSSSSLFAPEDLAITVFEWNYFYETPVLHDTDVLFNLDQNWSTDGSTDTDMEETALHEFGHVLGLDHCDDPDAVMYAYDTPAIIRELTADDEAGARTLYPEPVVIEPPPPVWVDVDPVTLSIDSVGPLEVGIGDLVRITGTVGNPGDEDARVSGIAMTPSVVPYLDPVSLAPGEEAPFDVQARVTEAPGEYPVRIRVYGSEGGRNFGSQEVATGGMLRISRGAIGFTMQDSISAELGPNGEDELALELLDGVRFDLALQPSGAGKSDWELALFDPDGREVRSEASEGVISFERLKAKRGGTWRVRVRNRVDGVCRYTVNSSGSPKKRKVKAKGTLGAGEETVEIPLPVLPARSELEALISVKGKGAPAPRVTGYRRPNGVLVELDSPLPALHDFPVTENGEYSLVIGLTERSMKTKKVSGKGVVPVGETTAEVLLRKVPGPCLLDAEAALAKLPEGAVARFAGYRTPSGEEVLFEAPVTAIRDLELTEAGDHVLLVEVEGAAGATKAGKVKVKGTIRTEAPAKIGVKGSFEMTDGLAKRL